MKQDIKQNEAKQNKTGYFKAGGADLPFYFRHIPKGMPSNFKRPRNTKKNTLKKKYRTTKGNNNNRRRRRRRSMPPFREGGLLPELLA